MDSCTNEVRFQYWKSIIAQCQARPEGQSAKQWMKANGICEQTYYHWQRKIRQATYELMYAPSSNLPSVQQTEEIAFAEVSVAAEPQKNDSMSVEASIRPVAIIKAEHFSVAVSAEISENMLSRILREISHA